jgi:hypothetical protein
MVGSQFTFVNNLRTQGKFEYQSGDALPCPYPGHHGRMFQSLDQLYDHAVNELHPSNILRGLEEAKLRVKYAVLVGICGGCRLTLLLGKVSTPVSVYRNWSPSPAARTVRPIPRTKSTTPKDMTRGTPAFYCSPILVQYHRKSLPQR